MIITFLPRWKRSCRVATRTGQKRSKHLLPVRQTFVNSFKEKFGTSDVYENVLPIKFVNMDEAAVFLKPNQSLQLVVKKLKRFPYTDLEVPREE